MQSTDINFILRESNDQFTPPKSKKKWVILGICIAVFIFLAAGLAAKSVFSSNIEDPDIYDPVTLQPKEPEGIFQRIKYLVFSKEVKLEGQKDDRINILLLGMGGPGHDGPYLTDTIMILSIKPSTGEAAMISIPRDLGVYIPGYGWWKINAANNFGEKEKPNWGGAFTTKVISETFDIDIPYYARIDFKAFEEIINEVGGVKVNVARSFTDAQYPAPNDAYQVVSFKAGEQTLNGEKALQYARSRHGNNSEGSDFARAKRQQQIILALKDKVFSLETLANPVKIYNIIKTLDTHITTNMEFSDMLTLLKLAKERVDTENIKTFVLDNSPGNFLESGTSASGAYILQPKTGSFDDINKFIKNIFNETPQNTIVVAKQEETINIDGTNIEIQNGTWSAGLAAKIGKVLSDDGFNITKIDNTEDRPMDFSGIYNVGKEFKPEILKALKEKLHISVRELADEALNFATSTDILVILGLDFEE